MSEPTRWERTGEHRRPLKGEWFDHCGPRQCSIHEQAAPFWILKEVTVPAAVPAEPEQQEQTRRYFGRDGGFPGPENVAYGWLEPNGDRWWMMKTGKAVPEDGYWTVARIEESISERSWKWLTPAEVARLSPPPPASPAPAAEGRVAELEKENAELKAKLRHFKETLDAIRIE